MKYFALLMLTLAACLISESGACAPDVAPPPIELSARFWQAELAPYEPAYLTLSLRNTTDKPVEVWVPRINHTLKLEVKVASTGATVKYSGEQGGPRAQKAVIPPGKTRRYTVNILEYYILPYAHGTYSASLRYPNRVIQEGVYPRGDWQQDLTFTVRKPTDDEGPAVNLIKEPGKDLLYPSNYQHLGPVVLVLYQRTAYAKYAWYWLGAFAERHLDLTSAAKCYRLQAAGYADFPLIDEVRYRAILCKNKAEIFDRALYQDDLRALLPKVEDFDVIRQIERDLAPPEPD